MDPMVQQDTPAEQPDPQLELSGTSWGGEQIQISIHCPSHGCPSLSSARKREKVFLKFTSRRGH